YGIAVDCAGNIYVTGSTGSTDFPTTPKAFQTAPKFSSTLFVTKLNPTGTALLYSTFLGGSFSPNVNGIAVDAAGNAYVTGTYISGDFPLFNPFQTAFKSNSGGHVFVTKLNPTGTALLYSTYLGGSGSDLGFG